MCLLNGVITVNLHAYKAELVRLVTGRLPGRPVTVRAAMVAAVVVIFKFTIDCHV